MMGREMPRFAAIVLAAAISAMTAEAQTLQSLSLRGHDQTLRLYGSPQGTPVIVSSGDGGWVHLGPEIATALSQRGYYVVGFDVRAYLAGFTSGAATLRTADEPKDYAVLARFASRTNGKKPARCRCSRPPMPKPSRSLPG
jgi:Bacterial virulence protein (VirJ)